MPLELAVPYVDNEQAKKLGAFWLQDHKTWIIPDHVRKIEPFKSWITFNDGCIVRKPYMICHSKTNCWRCGKETPMIALGATNYFAFEDGQWIKVPEPSLFSYIKSMDNEVADYLARSYPYFKPSYSKTLQEVFYRNNCLSCGMMQGDFFHHEEPGGAFIQNPGNDQPSKIYFETIELGNDYHIDAAYLVANMLWIDKNGGTASSQNLDFRKLK